MHLTGIGVFPVAKLVVLYACVSNREGSCGRPHIFNVDHSVKRCNIDIILNIIADESPSGSLLCSVVVVWSR